MKSYVAKWQVAIAAVAVCFIGADAKEDANQKDIQKWQGTWQATSMITDGTASPADAVKKMQFTVKGTDYHFQNGSFQERGVYRFNAAKTPSELDIVVGEGMDKGKTWLVIYEISGDRLTICLEKANTKRPRSFDGKAGTGNVLEVWERVRPAEVKSDFARTTIDLGMLVTNLDKSVKFYTDVIGFKEGAPFSVPAEYCADAGLTDKQPLSIRTLKLGEGDTATTLKLMELPQVSPKKTDNAFLHSQLGFRYLTIFVADADTALGRVQKAGLKPLGKGPMPLPPGLPAGMALMVIRDPDGNLIELIGPKR